MKASRLLVAIGVVVSVWLSAFRNAWAFDASQYLKAKAAGTVVLSKDANGRVFCTYTVFDTLTGKATGTPRVEEVLATDLRSQAAFYAQALADIAAAQTDVKALVAAAP